MKKIKKKAGEVAENEKLTKRGNLAYVSKKISGQVAEKEELTKEEIQKRAEALK